MKPTDQQTRHRKNKGSLSVFDEFSEPSGGGSIMFTPLLEQDSLKKIEERTKLADIPPDLRPVNIASKSTAHKTAISQHIASISPAEDQQIDSKKSDIDSISPSISTAHKTAISQQIDSISPAKWDVDALYGKEAEFLHFIFQKCQNSGSLITDKLSSEILRNQLKVSTKRISNLVERLTEKGVIVVNSSMRGKGAWRVFSIPTGVYRQLMLNHKDSKSTAIRQQLDSISPSISTAYKTAEPPSSSSVLNIKNITTTEPVNLEWQKIHLGPSETLGLSQYHVTRARELYPSLDPIAVQKLIYGFEKHLSLPENKKAIRNPGAFFLSLAEKLSKGESPLPEYKNPDDEILEKLQADALAKQQKHQERLNGLQATLFENWWCETSLEEKERLMPSGFAKGNIYKVAARAKWLEEVWPTLPQAKILQSSAQIPTP